MVHPFNGLVDPRAPGSVVPAVVKWVNDELDDPEKSLATKYHAAPLNPAVGDAHTRTVAELRVLKPFGLEETVKFASMSASKRSPDEWASVESQSMKHILHTFSILDVAQYPRIFHGQGAQATIQKGNSSMEVIAVIGASHEDCDKHVRERLPEHKGKLVLVGTRTTIPGTQDFGASTTKFLMNLQRRRRLHNRPVQLCALATRICLTPIAAQRTKLH
jgi:hypothetical protein